jgi:outer membrane protein insertion porin family
MAYPQASPLGCDPATTITAGRSCSIAILGFAVMWLSGCQNFPGFQTNANPAAGNGRFVDGPRSGSAMNPMTTAPAERSPGDRPLVTTDASRPPAGGYFLEDSPATNATSPWSPNAQTTDEDTAQAPTRRRPPARSGPWEMSDATVSPAAATQTIRGQSPGDFVPGAPARPVEELLAPLPGNSSFANPVNPQQGFNNNSGAIGSGVPQFGNAVPAAQSPFPFDPLMTQPTQFGGGPPSPPLDLPPGFNGYIPDVRDVPLDVYLQEARTGKVIFGGSVNTDLGVAGQIIIEERNFDLFRFPTSFRDLFGNAFKGDGQNFRLELMPGNQVQRYSINLTQPNLFGYSPWSLSTGASYFTRFYQDWGEQRLTGRAMLGYNVTQDLSVATEFNAQNIKLFDPRVAGIPQLDAAVGTNNLYTGRFRLNHNTRDSVFLPSEGHNIDVILDQVFGDFSFQKAQVNYSKYFLLRERADGTGRHTLTSSLQFGFSGKDTPIFENYFAGGHSTLRGFSFRGAGPVINGVQVGGRFQFIGSLEYNFPITADDALRMVTFVDYGTVDDSVEFNSENFRVAPGVGFRVSVPALGAAPLAFDFAVPVNYADTDDRQVFSFNVGVTR